MTYFASVNGSPIVSGNLMIPRVGIWTADLSLSTDAAITGTVPVVLGNLTLMGTIVRSESYGGQTRARIVGGYGGWRKTLRQQGYGNSAGVRLSMLLSDVASQVGEKLNVASDITIGNAFARIDGPASDVLWQLVSQKIIPSWHVDPFGVTQLTDWDPFDVVSDYTVTDQRPDEGIVVVATEDYADWLPGCSFASPLIQGTYTNAGVNYVFDNDGLFRLEVLTSDADDRVLGPLRSFIDSRISPTRFYGRYEYTISNPTTATIDGSPTDDTLGLPDLQNVPLTSDAIASYAPPADGTCHIMFVNGQATRPVCVWTSTSPTIANLLGGSNPVARLGDQVQVFLPPTLPIAGTLSGSPFTGIITVTNPISGAITQGSSDVNTS